MTEFSSSEYPAGDSLELSEIAAVVWRGKWIVVLLTLLAASGAYLVSRRITPVYEASTTLLVDQAPSAQTADSSAIAASLRLARTYAELLTKRPVIEETLASLGLETSLERTGSEVHVQLVEDTQLIELSVQSVDPVLAADLANTIVQVFAEQNEELQAGRFAASKASLSAQLDTVAEQIRAHEVAITNLGTPRTGGRVAELERLQSELSQLQASYSNLLQSYEQVRTSEARSISNVIQVEPAEAQTRPIRPHVMLNTLLAGAAGAAIGVVIVFLLQYVDDTLRTSEEVERILNAPVLGYIPKARDLGPNAEAPAAMAELEAQHFATVEAFRSLRTNLDLLDNPGLPDTVLVASPGMDDGKTTVASNLALTLSGDERSVALIDADFRRPGLHKALGVNNERGLSDMLTDGLEPSAVAVPLDIPGFTLITSGSSVADPTALLSSRRFSEVLAGLREQFDVIIFDGPPFLATEAVALAARLKSVLLVIQPGRTREAAAREIRKQVERARAELVGVVMNKAHPPELYGYGGYLYYHSQDGWPEVVDDVEDELVSVQEVEEQEAREELEPEELEPEEEAEVLTAEEESADEQEPQDELELEEEAEDDLVEEQADERVVEQVEELVEELEVEELVEEQVDEQVEVQAEEELVEEQVDEQAEEVLVEELVEEQEVEELVEEQVDEQVEVQAEEELVEEQVDEQAEEELVEEQVDEQAEEVLVEELVEEQVEEPAQEEPPQKEPGAAIVLASNGSEATQPRKPEPTGRPSILDPYKPLIDELLTGGDEDTSAEAITPRQIFQLIEAEGYSGSEQTLRRYVKRWREAANGQGS